jgi:hypothetical protein
MRCQSKSAIVVAGMKAVNGSFRPKLRPVRAAGRGPGEPLAPRAERITRRALHDSRHESTSAGKLVCGWQAVISYLALRAE